MVRRQKVPNKRKSPSLSAESNHAHNDVRDELRSLFASMEEDTQAFISGTRSSLHATSGLAGSSTSAGSFAPAGTSSNTLRQALEISTRATQGNGSGEDNEEGWVDEEPVKRKKARVSSNLYHGASAMDKNDQPDSAVNALRGMYSGMGAQLGSSDNNQQMPTRSEHDTSERNFIDKGKKRALVDDDDDDNGYNLVDSEYRQGENQEKGDSDGSVFAMPPPDPEMDAFGLCFAPSDLTASLKDDNEVDDFDKPRKGRQVEKRYKLVAKKRGDFFGGLSEYPEILIDLALHLDIASVLSLFCISKDFHQTINGHISHFSKQYTKKWAPESSRIFRFNFFSSLCSPDPVGRIAPGTGTIRLVPTLKWPQMIIHREKTVRDILACLARAGHRVTKTMKMTLRKMWMVMDVATSRMRARMMHNEQYMTDVDLYNIQLFCVKLDMRFNDPLDGSGSANLTRLMLGQRGLTPLCKLLKRERYLSLMEITQTQLRYRYYHPRGTPVAALTLPMFGIPAAEIGRGHLEGWGLGRTHLFRPDELCLMESTRRFLCLDKHLAYMMLHGYVNLSTREITLPTDEEMYMSDDDDTDIEDAGWDGLDPDTAAEEWVTDDEDGNEDQEAEETNIDAIMRDKDHLDQSNAGCSGQKEGFELPFRASCGS